MSKIVPIEDSIDERCTSCNKSLAGFSRKIWTLDHRRLAAFKLAGVKEVPVEWASKELVESQMWKMTTKTGGSSIKLKLDNGMSKIIR